MNYFAIAFVLIINIDQSVLASLEHYNDLHAYENKLLSIDHIQGKHRETIRLVFQYDDPIMVYAPASYQESNNSSINRYILPNTDVDSNCFCDYDFLQSNGKNLELILLGKIITIVHQANQIIITIEKNIYG